MCSVIFLAYDIPTIGKKLSLVDALISNPRNNKEPIIVKLEGTIHVLNSFT